MQSKSVSGCEVRQRSGTVGTVVDGDETDTGAEIVDIGCMVDWRRALKLAKGKCSICGNLNPAATILAGSVDDVKRATIACLEQAADSRTFLFSGGYEIPRFTPKENVPAMNEILRR